MEKKYNLELTREELMLISALVQMKSTGFEVPVHKDWYPLLHDLAMKLLIESTKPYLEGAEEKP